MAAAIMLAVSAAIWYNLAGSAARASCRRGVGAFVCRAGGLQRQEPSDRYPLRQGPSLAERTVLRLEQLLAHRRCSDPKSSDHKIIIDADASTGIASFDLDHLTGPERRTSSRRGRGSPTMMRPGAKTLIIGPGGGWDVSRALIARQPRISPQSRSTRSSRTTSCGSVSPMSAIGCISVLRCICTSKTAAALSGGVTEKYQVLQATLVDTWASTAAGAFALSENNLYTTDAFRDYLRHLTDDGMMVFTRWGFDPPRGVVATDFAGHGRAQ